MAAQGFEETFRTLELKDWHVAEYEFGHPMFDTDWSREQARAEGSLVLRLEPQAGKANGFVGGSVRRREPTHWGRYSAVIQPAAGSGVITGFFTYSGPAYGTRHDEIDIEFLGRDTRSMHAAWFVDGELRERMVPLGFDAADAPRIYSFDWLPDRIRWYAENKLILEITEADAPLPEVPGLLFANLWAADHSIASWSGRTDPKTRVEAVVQCVSFTPWIEGRFAAPENSCEDQEQFAAVDPGSPMSN